MYLHLIMDRVQRKDRVQIMYLHSDNGQGTEEEQEQICTYI